jgi:hypothetical protein
VGNLHAIKERGVLSPKQLKLLTELHKFGFCDTNSVLGQPIEYTIPLDIYHLTQMFFLKVWFSEGITSVYINVQIGIYQLYSVPTKAKTLDDIKQLYKLITGQELSEVNNENTNF